ncbi:MAG: radical SAM protein [Acidobacteria bacterium]|nr:radical SAM protein [Acidobacteriota bacterium]
MRGRRILWIQLGVPDAEYSYAENNLPTAAGYVLEHVRRHGLLEGYSFTLLDQSLADRAGDARLLDACLAGEPDVVCLTCQAWNVERSLHLAARLRAARPGTRVIAGGPEITPDGPWLDRPEVDVLVFGEGETGLPPALEALDRPAGERPRVIHAPPLESLSGAVDPYSVGLLAPGPHRNCLLETTRGCPFRCSYCNYAKRVPTVRRHDDAYLARFFAWARREGVEDVYLLDPSFGADPALAERLGNLARWNAGGIPLHSETRLENLTPPLAASFFRAGFRSVEVGLQSVHAAACRSVNRRLDLGAFEAGANAMRDAGVGLEVGVILGLPKDNLGGFRSTLEWLAARGLGDAAEVFHLSLLPGTALRETAIARRWRFMPRPPYYLLSGGSWDEASLLQGIYEVEDVLDRGHFLDIPPWFETPPDTDFVHHLRLGLSNPDDQLEAVLGGMRNWAAVVTLDLVGDPSRPAARKALERLARAALDTNPYGLFRLVLRTERPVAEREVMRIREAFTVGDQYWNRLNHFRDDPSGVFSCRVFQYVPAGRHLDFIPELADSADVVFALPGSLDAYEDLADRAESSGITGQVYAACDGPETDVARLCRERDVEERRVFLRLLREPG